MEEVEREVGDVAQATEVPGSKGFLGKSEEMREVGLFFLLDVLIFVVFWYCVFLFVEYCFVLE